MVKLVNKEEVGNVITLEFKVELNGKSDTFLWSNEWRSAQPWCGNFNDDEVDEIRSEIFQEVKGKYWIENN